jgi:hypothetical protein
MTLNQHGNPDIKVVDILKNQIVLIVQEFRALVLGGGVHSNTIAILAIWQELGFNFIFISWQDLVI